MSGKERKKYLKIEEKIFKSLGKTGYILIFVIVFSILMGIIDFILYCCVDNYYTFKFLLSGDMKFSEWMDLMIKTYHYSYFKTIFFALIFLSIGIYRTKALTKEFTK